MQDCGYLESGRSFSARSDTRLERDPKFKLSHRVVQWLILCANVSRPVLYFAFYCHKHHDQHGDGRVCYIAQVRALYGGRSGQGPASQSYRGVSANAGSLFMACST